MKLRSKEPYWLLKNGLINSYSSLSKDVNCDVLIIGAGITGSLMAYQLSKEGYKAILIDKRDIATGSTSATTAMIQYEIDEPLFSLIDKVGENAAVDSYLEGIKAIDALEKIVKKVGADCGFKKKRSLYIGASKKDLEWLSKEYETRRKFKIDVSWITKTELKRQFGVVGEGGILSKAGASLDAYNLAHALITYSIKHYDLSAFDRTDVEKVEYTEKSNIAITNTKNTIRCKHIIYASGYETVNIIPDRIVDLNSTYAFVSEPVKNIPPAIKNTIFWNTEDPYLYMRTTSDDRILVGGGDESFKNAARRDRLIDKKEDFLLERITQVFPKMKLIPDFSWAGTFGVTRDALPYIGPHPDFPNSYFILGFGGNGITFSVIGTQVILDALAVRHNKFLEYYRFGR